MPPPARPPWQPEQLNRTNSSRPSAVAPRAPWYGFVGRGGFLSGPGTGPTAVKIGGIEAIVAMSPGERSPQAAATTTAAPIASAARLKPKHINGISRRRVLLDVGHRPDYTERGRGIVGRDVGERHRAHPAADAGVDGDVLLAVG